MGKPSPLRAMLAASCIVALSAGHANAQERGNGARALMSIVATARANQASVQQQGSNNGAAVVQNGQANTAGIRQVGRGNTGAISQTGDNNTACLIQVGRGLDGSITQVGDNQSAGMIQTRRGTREIAPEVCSALSGDRRGAFMSAVRHATQRGRR